MPKMRIQSFNTIGGVDKFFRISLGHETLANYFQTNFSLIHHHKYSLTELENMIPWERDIYIILLSNYIDAENQRIRDLKAQIKK